MKPHLEAHCRYDVVRESTDNQSIFRKQEMTGSLHETAAHIFP
ncbi:MULTISPECIES: hypothetical protein [Nitrosomonas]|nr:MULTISPECIES: hypothetical protein [Nitrosomonas]UVS63104.1 hypothetical protein NX761_08440 [Nitrosomonas sp. PLL12]